MTFTAIKLDFYLILRIGELKGLKWDDISGDFLHIQRFVDDKNKIVEDIKGHASEGKRYMPLTPKAKEILAQIQILNPDSEYIFIRNGQPLATVTFNRRLKKCCEKLGIVYRSSHKLRFPPPPSCTRTEWKILNSKSSWATPVST